MSLSVVRDGIESEAPAPRDGQSSASVESIYTAHQSLVYRLALRYGNGDQQWAEDIVQDVFLDLFAEPSKIREVANVSGWLYRVTTNRCLTRLRRERFLHAAPVRWLLECRGASAPDPETLGIRDDRLHRVFRAVRDMPPKVRAAFYMHHVDGKSQTEIADILGCSKSYVCKVLARVTTELEALGLGEGGSSC